MWPHSRAPNHYTPSTTMNPLAPSFVPLDRLRDSVTPKARPAANMRSGGLPFASTAPPVPSVVPLLRRETYVPPAKLAAQRQLVESLLSPHAPIEPPREGSVTPRARWRPTTQLVSPAPRKAVVAPEVIYTTSNSATPIPAMITTSAPHEDDVTTAALFSYLALVEERLAGLVSLRVRDVVDRVSEAEVRRREADRWWVVHEALLSVMRIVYMHELEEVRRRFECAAWDLALNMPGEEDKKAREALANGSPS